MLHRTFFVVFMTAAAVFARGASAEENGDLVTALQTAAGGDRAFDVPRFKLLSVDKTPDRMKVATRWLSTEIEGGINLADVAKQLTDGWQVNTKLGPSPLGSIAFRAELYSFLAQDAVRTDNVSARSLVRAYIVMRGIDQTVGTRSEWGKNFLTMAKTGGFTEENSPELFSIAKRMVSTEGQGGPASMKLAEALEALIGASKEDRPGTALDLSAFCAAFKAAWTAEPYQCRLMSNNAGFLWRAACLARSREDAAAVTELERLAAELEPGTPEQLPRNWLRDAVRIGGPAPTDSGARIIRNPNDLKPN
jgi:hypothetical protein